MSDFPTEPTPPPSSNVRPLPTSDDAWVSDDTRRRRSMAAHPAGKRRVLEDLPTLGELREWRVPLVAQAPIDVLGDATWGGVSEFDEAASEVYAELLAVLASKQADYGPHAISRSPGGPLNGINVRMHDKLSRAINLAGLAGEPENEAIRDTYADLANYAVIAVMVLDGTWPK